MSTGTPILPDGCGYMGKDFGANYIDSQCFGGRLYDLDDCDGSLLYEPTEYKPCPQCKHDEWLERLLEEVEEAGWIAAEEGESRKSPYAAEKLRFPEDLEQMKSAWLKGYDSHGS